VLALNLRTSVQRDAIAANSQEESAGSISWEILEAFTTNIDNGNFARGFKIAIEVGAEPFASRERLLAFSAGRHPRLQDAAATSCVVARHSELLMKRPPLQKTTEDPLAESVQIWRS